MYIKNTTNNKTKKRKKFIHPEAAFCQNKKKKSDNAAKNVLRKFSAPNVLFTLKSFSVNKALGAENLQ